MNEDQPITISGRFSIDLDARSDSFSHILHVVAEELRSWIKVQASIFPQLSGSDSLPLFETNPGSGGLETSFQSTAVRLGGDSLPLLNG
jgi:hypothetical protein